MVLRKEGRIVSALQMIPYPMTFCGKVIPVSYISGACTHPDDRGQGGMRQLLQDTHRAMYEEGVWLSALIPAEGWLFDYYAKSGYTSGFGYAVESVPADSLRPSPDCRVEEEGAVSGMDASLESEHYRYFDIRMRERACCVQHSFEDFRVVMADLRLGGGKLLVARRKGVMVGLAFCVAEGVAVRVKELLADDGAVRDTLLWEAASAYKADVVELWRPSMSASRCLGMARAIHVQKMLSLFARQYPASRFYICLEGDEAIPENNGCYTVEDGTCCRGRVDGERYHTYTIGMLTRLLLDAEHPYMSLMLD